MNVAAGILTSAAVFRGEMHRMLLALGIVLLILFVSWAIQEWGMRKSASALGWLGLLCLALVGIGGGAFVAVGLF